METDKLLNPAGIIALIALIALAGWLLFRPRTSFGPNNQFNNQNINRTNDMANNMANQNPASNQPDFPPPVESKSLFPEGYQTGYIVAPMGSSWVKVNQNWELRVDSVLSDSRCPERVVCETSGKAIVKVQFQQIGVDYTKAYFEEMRVEGLNRFPPTGELKPNLFKPLKITGPVGDDRKDVSLNIALVDLIPHPELNDGGTLQKNYIALFKIIENE